MIAQNKIATLNQIRAQSIIDAVSAQKISQALRILSSLETSDVANIFEILPPEIQSVLAEQAVILLKPNFLLEIELSTREELLSKVTTIVLSKALSAMELKDAIEIVEDMSLAQRRSLLASIDPNIRKSIEDRLQYPEDSAGRIATKKPLCVPLGINIKRLQDIIRSSSEICDQIIVLDRTGKPKLAIKASTLCKKLCLITDESEIIDHLGEEIYKIKYDIDKADIPAIFLHHKIKIAAVIGQENEFLGVINIENILKIEAEEAAEDILQASGTPQYLGASTIFTALQRVKWLTANLIACALNSAILLQFINFEYNKYCITIITGIAAIAGACATQTASTTIRKLVRQNLNSTNLGYNLQKELQICFLIILIINILFSSYIFILTDSLGFALTILPIVSTLLLCGTLFGVLLPFLATRLGIDPGPISPLLTAITDILTTLIVFFYVGLFYSKGY